MKIEKKQEGNALTIAIEGRLDTLTAPDLESEITAIGPDVQNLTLDFAKLDYISSAGLRVLLKSQKKMAAQGSMRLINVGKMPREALEITGFIDILTVE
jgi:anti-sigma B factor antagonist